MNAVLSLPPQVIISAFIAAVLCILSASVWRLLFSLASPISAIRLRIIKGITDQVLLSQVAASDSELQNRLAAVQRLSRQDFLARIAIAATDSTVAWSAVGKLTNQELLADVFNNTTESEVRKYALWQISDEALLVEIASFADNSDVRIIAVGKIRDQGQLALIAKDADNWEVRKAAFRKLAVPDQSLIGAFLVAKLDSWNDRFVSDQNDRFISDLVEKLNDQATIAVVATHSPDWYVRKTAWKKLTAPDQSLIGAFLVGSLNFPYDEFVSDLVEKLNDQAIIAEVATKAFNCEVGTAALRKLTDLNALEAIEQIRLSYVAINDPSFLVSLNAWEKLTDQLILAKIATNNPDPHVRFMATTRLTDQLVLSKIAETDRNVDVCLAVLRNLTNPDETLLANIASENNWSLFDWEDDPDISYISDYMGQRRDRWVGKGSEILSATVKRLTDRSLLTKVSKEAMDSQARSDAHERLKELGYC